MPFEVPPLPALKTQPQARDLLLSVTPTRRAPSYLLTGPAGTGKATHALSLVRTLFCVGGPSCPGCVPCRQVLKRIHPDLVWVDREYVSAHSRKEARSLAINVDSMQALRADMRAAPLSAPLKVAVVPNADLLTEDAQDVLLKTLEEPPPRVLMVLLSERPARLKPTIPSRCRTVRFSPVPSALMEEALVASHGFDVPRAREASLWSDGDFREALRYADPAWRPFRERVTEDFDRAVSGRTMDWMGAASTYERPDWDFGGGEEDLTEAQARRKAVQGVLKVYLSLWARRMSGTLPVPEALKRLPPDGAAATLNRHLEALEGNLAPRMVLDHLFLTLREGLRTGRVETRSFFDLAVS
jgi:hypothetical protein